MTVYNGENDDCAIDHANEKLLIDYIVACTNLYGYTPFEIAAEVYTAQTNVDVSEERIRSFAAQQTVKKQLEEYFVYIRQNAFLAEVLLEFEEVSRLKKETAGKPYYIPEQKELLRYTNEMYYERTDEQETLKELLYKDFGVSVDREETVLELVFNLGISEGDITRVLSQFLEDLGLPFEQAENYIPVIIDIANTTRLWENRGHTPKELQQIIESY